MTTASEAPAPAPATDPATPPPVRGWRRLLRLWPWFLGAGIIVFLVRRVPVRAFRDAMSHGPHLEMASFVVAQQLVGLGLDSFATWANLWAVRLTVPLRRLAVVRAASYLLALVHYSLGQGGIGYYLHKRGTKAVYATGTVLMMIGINLAALGVLSGVSLLLGSQHGLPPAIGWTVAAVCAGFTLYLGLIALRPAPLLRVQLFAPLFEAGVRRHLLALAARLPHTMWFVVAQWMALRIWGIHVPFLQGMLLLPVLGLLASLPLTPAGLGVAQASQVLLFHSFAPGATMEQRKAYVLVYSIVVYVYGVITVAGIGLAALPAARRVQAETVPVPTPSADARVT